MRGCVGVWEYACVLVYVCVFGCMGAWMCGRMGGRGCVGGCKCMGVGVSECRYMDVLGIGVLMVNCITCASS